MLGLSSQVYFTMSNFQQTTVSYVIFLVEWAKDLVTFSAHKTCVATDRFWIESQRWPSPRSSMFVTLCLFTQTSRIQTFVVCFLYGECYERTAAL